MTWMIRIKRSDHRLFDVDGQNRTKPVLPLVQIKSDRHAATSTEEINHKVLSLGRRHGRAESDLSQVALPVLPTPDITPGVYQCKLRRALWFVGQPSTILCKRVAPDVFP